MNERIKELAEQARAWVNNTDNVSPDIEYVFYKDAYDKKFAELIINECIMICKSHKIQSTDDVWYLAHNETVNNISENIEEYFGVEE